METNVLRRSMPVSPLCQQEGAQVGLPRAPALHAVLHTLGPMPPPHPRVIQPAKPPAPAAKATPALFWVAVVMVAFFFIKSEAARAKGLTWWGKAVSSKTDRFLTAFQNGPAGKGFNDAFQQVVNRLVGLGPEKVVGGLVVASLAVAALSPPGTFQLYHTVNDIPPSVFKQRVIIQGKVLRVADGDTFRVRHAPNFPLARRGDFRGRLSDETLLIRLAGVDTPEVAKRGEPGQAYGEEAKVFVERAILDKNVKLKMLRKDQYSRGVAAVKYGTWPLTKDLSEELLKQGLAVVYRQGGAEYDHRKDRFEQLEAKAKAQGRGLWQGAGRGGREVELPSTYKARMRADQKNSRVPTPAY